MIFQWTFLSKRVGLHPSTSFLIHKEFHRAQIGLEILDPPLPVGVQGKFHFKRELYRPHSD